MKAALFLAICFLVILTSFATDKSHFDPAGLVGEWKGVGEVVLPMTSYTMEIDGKASFRWDSAGEFLRTELTGSKVFFTYSDTGHLYYDPATDSLMWEIWNNLGRHLIYRGSVSEGVIRGSARRRSLLYNLTARLVPADFPDSIFFKLTVVDDEGESADRGNFTLWRAKPRSDNE